MGCNGLCSEFPARRLSSKHGSLYQDNFYCKTCQRYVSPLCTIQLHNCRLCTCCRKQVKSKSYRKPRPLVIRVQE